MGRSLTKGNDVLLVEGPHDMLRLPLAAHLHKTIKLVDGSEYFRMPMSYRVNGDGTRSTCYLWTEWSPKKREEP